MVKVPRVWRLHLSKVMKAVSRPGQALAFGGPLYQGGPGVRPEPGQSRGDDVKDRHSRPAEGLVCGVRNVAENPCQGRASCRKS
jgi:hypothetical protein